MVEINDKECESDLDDRTMGGDLQHELYDMFDWANCYEDNFPIFEDEDLIDIYTIVSAHGHVDHATLTAVYVAVRPFC